MSILENFYKVSSTSITLPTSHIHICSFGSSRIALLWLGWRFPHPLRILCILYSSMFVSLGFGVSWCRSRYRLLLFRSLRCGAMVSMGLSLLCRCICLCLNLLILIVHIHTCRSLSLLQVSIPYCCSNPSVLCLWILLQVVWSWHVKET